MTTPYVWFTITTGTYRRRLRERTAERAILYAFRSWPPAAPGILTKVHKENVIGWYFETAHWLSRAGYSTPKRAARPGR